MIQLNHGYTIFFTVELAGVATAADSTPTATLYRNGSASGVTVTVSTTAVTGLYVATFTTDAGWAKTDVLHLTIAATIDSTSGYVAVVWDSTGDVDAVMRGTDGANTTAPDNAAITNIETKIDDILDDTSTTLPGLIAAIDAGSGSGARTITITVTDGTNPLQNARVRLTELNNSANTFTALTNVSGVVALNVDDATYTVAITKSNYSFAGASLVVDGDETQTYAMTLVSVSPPADATSSTGVAIVYDENETAEPSVPVYFRKYVSGGPGTAGYIEDYAVKTLTSDANGNIEGQFRRLWTYEVWRGDGTIKRRFTVPDADSFSIAEALGADV